MFQSMFLCGSKKNIPVTSLLLHRTYIKPIGMSSLSKTLYFILFIIVAGCSTSKKIADPKYIPESQELYNTVVRLDSLFFDAYNTCKPEVMDSLIAEDVEFYHDRGGLNTSKKDLVEALKKNICNKVTRHLKPGSIEVYPVPDYGAVEMGKHAFFNKEEPNEPMHYSKFVQLWKNTNGKWQMTRVISLH